MRVLFAMFCCVLLTCSIRAADRPNVIVILVDDMGWSDLSCYGSEIPTPNLDALARNGLRFTQFYNTGRCCPTRASLQTGLYAHQTGVGHMTDDKGAPGYQGRLNDQCVTFGEVMKPAGYTTIMCGKWHVGQNFGVAPWTRGYELTLNAAAGGFFFPDSPRTELFLNGRNVGRRGGPLPDQWYSSDLWTDFGIQFIDQSLAAKKPFMMYLAYNAPHFPLQAPDEDIAGFRGKYKAIGWDKLREQRHARQKQLGLVDANWPLAPRPPEVAAWDSLSEADKDRFDHIMAIYAACVSRMDSAVGRLVASLQQRGVLDDTAIFFMSDNGGNAESGPQGKLNGDHPGGPKSDVYCGQSWATLENTPFRLYKHYNHEGGISTPLIVHWPAGISARGEIRRQPGHLIDIMATMVDIAGVSYPKVLNGKPILPMEGRSLRPAFENKAVERDAFFWEHEGNAAVRVGDWKLVRKGASGPWELYDLNADRTEMHDLASQQPQKAEELKAKWHAWAERCMVKPLPSGEGKKAGKKKNAKKKAARE